MTQAYDEIGNKHIFKIVFKVGPITTLDNQYDYVACILSTWIHEKHKQFRV
jgi:hypothetical protein